jgi:hypothetical protein
VKKSSLMTGLEAAAGKGAAVTEFGTAGRSATGKAPAGTVTIAAHYAPEVRRTLKMIEAETGKRLKPLLGEAINDLCAKYGKPQPYAVEE